MHKIEQGLIGAGTPDFGKLVSRLMLIDSRDDLELATEMLSEELAARAADARFDLSARFVVSVRVVAKSGTAEDAATLGHEMVLKAEEAGSPELLVEGQCWILLAALRGDPASRAYVDNHCLKGSDMDRKISAPSGTVPEDARRLESLFRNAEQLAADGDLNEFEAVSMEDGPGRVVLSAIGDAKSKDGIELQKRFKNVVGVRLPYGGALPGRGEIGGRLTARWPWAADAARYIEGRMALMRHSFSEFVRLPPLLLVGETGSGKTTLALELADILGLDAMLVSCGGVADSGGLAATSRGWTTNRPSAPFLAMAQSGTANPVLVLDELDKGTPARSQNGSVWASALSMLEKSDRYHDSCLQADVDLSACTFIATANDTSVLPPELRDRFQIVKVPRPRPEDFPVVLEGVLLDEAKALQTDVDLLPELDRDDRAFLNDMFLQRRNSLRSIRKVVGLLLAEKAASCEMEPRMLH